MPAFILALISYIAPFIFKRAFLIFWHLAFASARVMALRRLVAGRALDFEEELCCIST
jgi:uncharacterized membrane protein